MIWVEVRMHTASSVHPGAHLLRSIPGEPMADPFLKVKHGARIPSIDHDEKSQKMS